MDTLGVPKTYKETIVGIGDRKSLYFLGKKIPYLKQAMVAAKRLINPYRVFSLTMDNGPENAGYQILKVPTFFCHPYSAWEKPIIENAFRRLRRYIPKKSCLSNYSDEQISFIIDRVNNIPPNLLAGERLRRFSFKNNQFNYQFLTLSVALRGRISLSIFIIMANAIILSISDNLF